MIKKVLSVTILLAVLYTAFYYGLYIGVLFGLDRSLKVEYSSLNNLITVTNKLKKLKSESDIDEAVSNYTSAIKDGLEKSQESLNEIVFWKILFSPIESLTFVSSGMVEPYPVINLREVKEPEPLKTKNGNVQSN